MILLESCSSFLSQAERQILVAECSQQGRRPPRGFSLPVQIIGSSSQICKNLTYGDWDCQEARQQGEIRHVLHIPQISMECHDLAGKPAHSSTDMLFDIRVRRCTCQGCVLQGMGHAESNLCAMARIVQIPADGRRLSVPETGVATPGLLQDLRSIQSGLTIQPSGM